MEAREEAGELLAIEGDVDYRTGDISFAGEIVIGGSVTRGFTVKAGARLSISGLVEEGATISSRSDVWVGQGVVGRKTRVVTGGSLQAEFVCGAGITAGRDIRLTDFAFQARLQAGGRIVVGRNSCAQGGSITGGQTWAMHGIETFTAGSTDGVESVLVAGLGRDQARELERVERSISASNTQIERILDRLELRTVDVNQIRNLISGATGPNRRLLVRRARQLGELGQTYQQLLIRRRAIVARLDGGTGEIKIWDTAYPGVVVRVGEHQCSIQDERRSPHFLVKGDRLTGC